MANIVLDFLHNYQTGERRETEPANAYQYDEGHVLEAVLPEVITACEIHYWIRGMEEADAYTPTSITPNSDDSCTVLGNIPNKYFETNGELRIYIVVTDGTASITTYEGKLHICQRSMPDDYVDDDPENEAVRVIAEARAAATTATQQAQAASASAGQAQQSAETLSGSVAQIATNTQDITALKEDLTAAQAELAKKANTDGYYEEMTVGDAEQLVSTVTNADDTPYNFRTTAGSADVGDRAYVDAIVGGTVALNQLVDSASIPATKTESGVTFTNNGDGTITVNGTATADIVYAVNPQKTWSDHKYMISGCPKGGSTSTYNLAMRGMGADLFDTGNGNLWNATGNAWKGAVIYIKSGATVTNLVFKPNIFDLTQIFGTTIADYVYGLESATAGAGVSWLKANAPKIFNGGYIPFNAGTLQSVVGLSEKRNTGLNQWDEEVVSGYYNSSGVLTSANNQICTKNKIKVIPSAQYCLTVPIASGTNELYACEYDGNETFMQRQALGNYSASVGQTLYSPSANCHYITVNFNTPYGTTYNHDICINLHWDGERDGEYEPYVKRSYPLDSSLTLRGIPKLDSANNLYYDGDTYESDGTVTRRYNYLEYDGSSDENWILQSINSSGIANFSISIPDYDTTPTSGFNNISNRFGRQTSLIGNTTTEGYMLAGGGTLYIRIASTKADTVAAFRTWLASNPTAFVYMLATPTTETAEPYQNPQIVDDFGTEEFITTSLVPVGHETRYAPNLRAKLEMSPDSPDGDGLYIVQQSGGENTYIPLASSATIQNILERLTALENA